MVTVLEASLDDEHSLLVHLNVGHGRQKVKVRVLVHHLCVVNSIHESLGLLMAINLIKLQQRM